MKKIRINLKHESSPCLHVERVDFYRFVCQICYVFRIIDRFIVVKISINLQKSLLLRLLSVKYSLRNQIAVLIVFMFPSIAAVASLVDKTELPVSKLTTALIYDFNLDNASTAPSDDLCNEVIFWLKKPSAIRNQFDDYRRVPLVLSLFFDMGDADFLGKQIILPQKVSTRSISHDSFETYDLSEIQVNNGDLIFFKDEDGNEYYLEETRSNLKSITINVKNTDPISIELGGPFPKRKGLICNFIKT